MMKLNGIVLVCVLLAGVVLWACLARPTTRRCRPRRYRPWMGAIASNLVSGQHHDGTGGGGAYN